MAETIKGLNIKLGLDASELNDSLTKVKSNLKEQQSDLKAINQQLKFNPNNLETWKNKQARLNETLESTKTKLQLQNRQLEEAKKKNDTVGKSLAKTGLLLVAVSEIVLLVSDFIDYRKAPHGSPKAAAQRQMKSACILVLGNQQLK